MLDLRRAIDADFFIAFDASVLHDGHFVAFFAYKTVKTIFVRF